MGGWVYAIAALFATSAILIAETEADGQSQPQQQPASLFELLCPTSDAASSVDDQGGHGGSAVEQPPNAIQRLIVAHQTPEPDQCREKRVVLWPDRLGNRHLNFVKRTGVGGQMSQMITAFGYALAVGAIFTIAPMSTQYAPKLDCPESSLQCFLQPLSSCTSADANGQSLQNFSQSFPHSYALSFVLFVPAENQSGCTDNIGVACDTCVLCVLWRAAGTNMGSTTSRPLHSCTTACQKCSTQRACFVRCINS